MAGNGRGRRGGRDRGRGRAEAEQPARGSRPVGEKKRSRRGAAAGDGGSGCLLPILGLLALLAIGLILFFVLRGGDDDDASTTSTDSTSTTSATTAASDGGETTTPVGGGAGPAGAGTISTSGGEAVLPLPSGGLESFSGEDVSGSSVPVESVVSDEGFWVGESTADRVFVQLDISGESPFQVEAGQAVTLEGVVTALESDAASVGVTDEEGSSQLTSQGQYIVVSELSQG